MGLTLVQYDNLECPAYVCDLCGRPIQVSEGIVLWHPDYTADNELVAELHYVHQGECDRIFTRANRPQHYWSRELTEFRAQLEHNTTIGFAERCICPEHYPCFCGYCLERND